MVKEWTEYDIENEIHILKDLIDSIKRQIISTEDSRFFENYYFSNGKTVIYVTPLHSIHNDIILSNSDSKDDAPPKDEAPAIVGFQTTDSAIVKMFEKRFEKFREAIEKQ